MVTMVMSCKFLMNVRVRYKNSKEKAEGYGVESNACRFLTLFGNFC